MLFDKNMFFELFSSSVLVQIKKNILTRFYQLLTVPIWKFCNFSIMDYRSNKCLASKVHYFKVFQVFGQTKITCLDSGLNSCFLKLLFSNQVLQVLLTFSLAKCIIFLVIVQLVFTFSKLFSGFRYELYCASKSYKTTHCVVHCDVSPQDAWNW